LLRALIAVASLSASGLWGRVGVIKVMGGLRDALASECIHVFRNRPHGYKLGALLDKLG
jgi:hypothetical protein